jgi:cytochrome b
MSHPRIFDLPTRVFHWTFAGLFVAAYAIGSTVDDESPRFVLHMLAGGLLATAVLLRLLWGLAGTRHARLSDFSLSPAALVGYLRGVLSGQARTWAGHNPASSWAALVMMGLGLGMAATGLAMVAGVAPHAVEEVHEVLANAFLAVALLHVAGVLVHVLRHRDALPLSMVTGRKRGIAATEADVRPHAGVALAFVAVLAAVGAGVATRYDASRGRITLFGQTLTLREADEGSGEQGGADDEQAEHEAHARGERAEDVPHS